MRLSERSWTRCPPLQSALRPTQKTGVGPMVSQKQYERVQSYIRKGIEEGAEVLAGGEGRPEGFEAGYFVKPTVFVNVRNDMAIAQEEIFGPVCFVCGSLMTSRGQMQAIRIANDSKYAADFARRRTRDRPSASASRRLTNTRRSRRD